jgi:hypothetical protein
MNGRDGFGHLAIDKDIIKMDLNKLGIRMWTEFLCEE